MLTTSSGVYPAISAVDLSNVSVRKLDRRTDSEFQPVMRESLDSKSVAFSISLRASEQPEAKQSGN
jgi:hypothetical protein